MEAKKVVLKLVHKCVISNGDEKTIASIEDRTLQNQTLHKYLKEKCTYETLKTACDAIMAVKGNPKMKAYGGHEEGLRSRYVHVCVEGVGFVHVDCVCLFAGISITMPITSHPYIYV